MSNVGWVRERDYNGEVWIEIGLGKQGVMYRFETVLSKQGVLKTEWEMALGRTGCCAEH